MLAHPTVRVWRKRSWRSGTELLGPDITMVLDEELEIIEGTIPHETTDK